LAIYHLSVKPVTRAAGRSATAAAAYRAGQRIRDHSSGQVFDYTRKRGVEHAEILLPTAAARRDLQWARNREALWNAAERAEQRSNSRVAREYELALPCEINRRQRVELVRAFSLEIANRYAVAVDFALHAPHRGGDGRNYHAHVLTTTRTLQSTGLGAKAALEWSDGNRRKAGLCPAKDDITEIRARWATLTNAALLEQGSEERIDHRTLLAQGIGREATLHRGPAISAILDRGASSRVADHWREESIERLRVAQEMGALARDRDLLRSHILDLTTRLATASREREAAQPRAAMTLDERRARARQDWLDYRRTQRAATQEPLDRDEAHGVDSGQDDSEEGKAKDRSRERDDDDFSL